MTCGISASVGLDGMAQPEPIVGCGSRALKAEIEKLDRIIRDNCGHEA